MSTEVKTEKKISPKTMSIKTRKLMYIGFILLFILVLVGVNVLTSVLVKRNPSIELDLTSNKAYSLQDATVEYLNYVDGGINVKVLMTEEELIGIDSTYGYQVNQLLREMSTWDSINVEYLEVEMTSVTELSEKYSDIDWTNLEDVLIVESEKTGKYYGIKNEDIFSYQLDYTTSEYVIMGQNLESEVLSAIQTVSTDKVVKAAVSVGNGEPLSEESEYYYMVSNFLSSLEKNAYELVNVDLMKQNVPEDADVLIMMGTVYDLTEEGAENVSKWLQNDGDMGKTLFYVPVLTESKTPNIDLLLEQWSMNVTKGGVVEMDTTKLNAGGGGFFPDYVDETYTENLKNPDLAVIMANQYTRPIEITDESVASPLLVSSADAQVYMYSENEVLPEKEDGYNVAAVATKNGEGASSNIVVWGSLGSFTPDVFSVYNNESYVINLLNTLSDNKISAIAMNSVPLGGNQMVVTEANSAVFRTVFVIIVPILLLVFGIVVWVRRRNR